MAELRVEHPTVTAVLASSDACDRLDAAGGTLLRIAPREALLVGGEDLEALRASVGEPTALVEDVSEAWRAFVLVGDGVADVFTRLSELAPPDPGGWIQGEVVHAPAKVLAGPDDLTVLVPAHLAAHVEERIRADAAEVLS